MKIKSGDVVKVKAYGGKFLFLYVIKLEKNSVIVTNKEEYDTALSKGVEPQIQVGFPVNDVVEVMQST